MIMYYNTIWSFTKTNTSQSSLGMKCQHAYPTRISIYIAELQSSNGSFFSNAPPKFRKSHDAKYGTSESEGDHFASDWDRSFGWI